MKALTFRSIIGSGGAAILYTGSDEATPSWYWLYDCLEDEGLTPSPA